MLFEAPLVGGKKASKFSLVKDDIRICVFKEGVNNELIFEILDNDKDEVMHSINAIILDAMMMQK